MSSNEDQLRADLGGELQDMEADGQTDSDQDGGGVSTTETDTATADSDDASFNFAEQGGDIEDETGGPISGDRDGLEDDALVDSVPDMDDGQSAGDTSQTTADEDVQETVAEAQTSVTEQQTASGGATGGDLAGDQIGAAVAGAQSAVAEQQVGGSRQTTRDQRQAETGTQTSMEPEGDMSTFGQPSQDSLGIDQGRQVTFRTRAARDLEDQLGRDVSPDQVRLERDQQTGQVTGRLSQQGQRELLAERLTEETGDTYIVSRFGEVRLSEDERREQERERQDILAGRRQNELERVESRIERQTGEDVEAGEDFTITDAGNVEFTEDFIAEQDRRATPTTFGRGASLTDITGEGRTRSGEGEISEVASTRLQAGFAGEDADAPQTRTGAFVAGIVSDGPLESTGVVQAVDQAVQASPDPDIEANLSEGGLLSESDEATLRGLSEDFQAGVQGVVQSDAVQPVLGGFANLQSGFQGGESEAFQSNLAASEAALTGGAGILDPAGIALAGEQVSEGVIGGTQTLVRNPTLETLTEIGEAGAAVTGTAAETGAVAFEENPAQTVSALVGAGVVGGVTAVGTGVAASRAATRLRSGVRAGRADEVVDIEDVTTEEAAETGELPEFETDTDAPTRQAVEEVRERAADQPEDLSDVTDTDEILFRSESEALPDEFTAQRGSSELPGLFASPDLSPLRLQEGGSSVGISLRLPRLGGRGDQVTAFPGDRIEGMPASATGARRIRGPEGDPIPDPEAGGAQFLDELADTGTAFVRPTGSRTTELEAIFPPGSEFTQTGNFAVRLQSGRVVPARSFRRADTDADVADEITDEETVTLSEVPLTRISRDTDEPVGPTPLSAGTTTTTTPTGTTTGATTATGTATGGTTAVTRVDDDGAASSLGDDGSTVPTRPTGTEPGVTVGSLGATSLAESEEGPATSPTEPVADSEPSEPTTPTEPNSPVDTSLSGGSGFTSVGPTRPPTSPPSSPPSSPPGSPPATPPSSPPFTPSGGGPPSPPTRPPRTFDTPDTDADEDDGLALIEGLSDPRGIDFLDPLSGGVLETDLFEGRGP